MDGKEIRKPIPKYANILPQLDDTMSSDTKIDNIIHAMEQIRIRKAYFEGKLKKLEQLKLSEKQFEFKDWSVEAEKIIMSAEGIHWVPLESYPDMMTKYSQSLGATKGEWVDVFSLDKEILDTIPRPVSAVILLFPIKPKYDEERTVQDDLIKQNGQVVAPDLFYMKQTVHNACGTVGVIHALANNTETVELKEESTLWKFLDKTKELSYLERAKVLENSSEIAQAHEQSASEGQTEAPSSEEKLITHFVTFVHRGGHLYELDGRREFPINRGDTTPESLLEDAAKICKAYMDNDPEEYRFTVVALTNPSG